MLRKEDTLPIEQQEEYELLTDNPYEFYYGHKAGMKIRRVSAWLSGNGCGVRQAYFVPYEEPASSYAFIAWEDHVKPLLGQLEIEL